MSSPMHKTNNKGGASEIETFAMANCLMILSSQAAAAASARATTGGSKPLAADETGMFTCKTCDRKFPSFQALGGHRASHKKVRSLPSISNTPAPEKTPKAHACSICGQEFLIGQALGGHMRRHRQVPLAAAGGGGSTVTTEVSTENSDGGSDCDKKKRKNDDDVLTLMPEKSSVVVRQGKRVCLDFDLNFIPAGKFEKEDEGEIEQGEIVEERDFLNLKLELRQPINC